MSQGRLASTVCGDAVGRAGLVQGTEEDAAVAMVKAMLGSDAAGRAGLIQVIEEGAAVAMVKAMQRQCNVLI